MFHGFRGFVGLFVELSLFRQTVLGFSRFGGLFVGLGSGGIISRSRARSGTSSIHMLPHMEDHALEFILFDKDRASGESCSPQKTNLFCLLCFTRLFICCSFS